MSSQPHKPKTYTVTAKGPINIGGRLVRRGDRVALSDAQARIYAAAFADAPKKAPVKADASKAASTSKDSAG